MRLLMDRKEIVAKLGHRKTNYCDIARVTGLSTQCLKNVLNRDGNMTLNTLVKLSKYFNLYKEDVTM